MLGLTGLRAARRPEDLIAALPLLVAILLGFSLAVFVLALFTDGIMYAVLVLVGLIAALGAVGLIGGTVAWRTGLLALPGAAAPSAPPAIALAGDDEAPAEDAGAPRRRLHALRVEGRPRG